MKQTQEKQLKFPPAAHFFPHFCCTANHYALLYSERHGKESTANPSISSDRICQDLTKINDSKASMMRAAQ
jgi:hypothetical protein